MVVEINGLELNYEMAGDGEPLLWLHGFMGAGPDWKYIFKEPPAGFRLIAPDLRGHGASTNPSGEFSFRQAADDVAGLLRHPGSHLWVVPNAGHGPVFGDSAPRFADTATSFLRGGWQRAS